MHFFVIPQKLRMSIFFRSLKRYAQFSCGIRCLKSNEHIAESPSVTGSRKKNRVNDLYFEKSSIDTVFCGMTGTNFLRDDRDGSRIMEINILRTPMLIDSHCHLNMLAQYPDNVDAVLNAAKAHDVQAMLCVSVDLDTLPQVIALAEKYPQVFASVGVHPNDLTGVALNTEKLITLAQHPRVIALGETGLDYYRTTEETEKALQKKCFAMHIAAAKATQKPLIIHTRAAQADTIDVLTNEAADEIGGVMHCFTEDWEMAKQALDLGFYISLSGIVTFKSAQQIQDVAKKVPLDRLLVETDAPYLAPIPHRGKPNEPAYVRYTAEFIADLRQISYVELAQATTENFLRLFKVDDTLIKQ